VSTSTGSGSTELIPYQEPAKPVPYEELGRPIQGPRALTDDWGRFWHLAFNLAVTQWKLRFFGSALGYLWQLVRPLLLFAVLYLFFTKFARVKLVGPAGDFYGTQLLGAIVLYTFFAEATMGSIRSVVDSEVLVRKIQFPRMVIPLSYVLLAFFNLCLNLTVVLFFGLIQGVRPTLSWLEAIPIIGMLVVLCTGIAMLLSAGFVYFRDLSPIWEVVNQIVFYASAVLVPIQLVQEYFTEHGVSQNLIHFYMLNPLTDVFQQFRHACITKSQPGAAYFLGGSIHLLEPIGIVIVTFCLGFWVFNRTAPRVAEDL
jgi:ABC-2 type transport system permease protein